MRVRSKPDSPLRSSPHPSPSPAGRGASKPTAVVAQRRQPLTRVRRHDAGRWFRPARAALLRVESAQIRSAAWQAVLDKSAGPPPFNQRRHSGSGERRTVRWLRSKNPASAAAAQTVKENALAHSHPHGRRIGHLASRHHPVAVLNRARAAAWSALSGSSAATGRRTGGSSCGRSAGTAH